MNKILMTILLTALIGCEEPTIITFDAGPAGPSFAESDSKYRSDIISPVYFRSE